MKKIAFLFIFSVLYLGSYSQPPSGKAKPGNVYGSKIDDKSTIPAEDLPQLLANKDTAHVKVKASVVDVCSSKGCWMTFKVNDSTQVFVKMKDYAFFVPMDLKGKSVVLEGKTFVKTTSVAELKHYAEDAKKPQAEIDAITKPKNEIRMIADGILVVK